MEVTNYLLTGMILQVGDFQVKPVDNVLSRGGCLLHLEVVDAGGHVLPAQNVVRVWCLRTPVGWDVKMRRIINVVRPIYENG